MRMRRLVCAFVVRKPKKTGFFLHQGPHDRCSKILNTTRVVSGGRSSAKRYQYFVTTAHPGTFEIAPKDKKVNTKLGVSDGKKMKY